jgi:hypothetical protein
MVTRISQAGDKSKVIHNLGKTGRNVDSVNNPSIQVDGFVTGRRVGPGGWNVPSNSAEYQRGYRQRQAELDSLRKDERKLEIAMLLEIKAELKSLRKNLRKFLTKSADSDKPTSIKKEDIKKEDISSLESESVSLPPHRLASRVSPLPEKPHRESEKARLARLAAWMPSDEHRELAGKRGHDDAWVDATADAYRAFQPNAKTKHKDFDAGFTSWILRAETFEGNGNGHAKKPTARDERFIAGELVVRARAARRAAGQPHDEPLLDRQGSLGYPPSRN